MGRDEEVKQAIGAVARLGGFTIKRVATTDDLKDRTLTITLTRVSDGWVQERLDFEDIPAQLAIVDGTNGHVEEVITQPGDHAETEALANAEIAALAGTIEGVTPEPVALVAGETPEPEEVDPDQLRDPSTPLVGELAAAVRRRR